MMADESMEQDLKQVGWRFGLMEIAKLDLKPGDVLLVKLPEGTSQYLIDQAGKVLNGVLPKGTKHLIVTIDATFSVVSQKDIPADPPPPGAFLRRLPPVNR